MAYGTAVEYRGELIRKSKNLRGMLEYARISKVSRVELSPAGKLNGRLRVVYANGATSSAHFASYHIMVDWVRNRRSWRGAEFFYYGGEVGYLTKPGIIAGN